jgi:2-keto-4-pentenoate hydratase/2-oxohepta-3-ene-1,7-dioic acid hydratase in catechol pathway
MKIFRVRPKGAPSAVFALGEGGLFDPSRGRFTEVLTPFDELIDGLDALATGRTFEAQDVDVLAPVEPSKVVCVGLNYQKHADEMGKAVPEEPLLFMKPSTAVIASGEAIELPTQSSEVHYEGELAIVIGRWTSKVDEAEALSYVLGYTCANDVTARDIQRREQRYTRAKGFDTFCPLGPCIVLARDFDPSEHRLELRVNGEVRQRSPLDDFIFSIPRVVSFVSHIMTLLPGDVILTGTPAGVGPMTDGDRVEVEIDGIGLLSNPVTSP